MLLHLNLDSVVDFSASQRETLVVHRTGDSVGSKSGWEGSIRVAECMAA